MRFEVLNKRKKQEIDNLLEENYNIKLPRCQLIQQSKERLRIFTGNLSEHELGILNSTINLDSIGLYFSFFKEKDFRVSFDSCFLFKEARKNVLELDEKQKQKWLAGEDVEINLENINKNNFTSNFIFLRYKQDIVGCGKFVPSQNKILNFVPKERRIKY
jgi:NOL1/NOP2/fmu family ribosome biogenesis protein